MRSKGAEKVHVIRSDPLSRECRNRCLCHSEPKAKNLLWQISTAACSKQCFAFAPLVFAFISNELKADPSLSLRMTGTFATASFKVEEGDRLYSLIVLLSDLSLNGQGFTPRAIVRRGQRRGRLLKGRSTPFLGVLCASE